MDDFEEMVGACGGAAECRLARPVGGVHHKPVPGHVAANVVAAGIAACFIDCQVTISQWPPDVSHAGDPQVQYLRQDVPRWPKRALQDLLTDALRWVGGAAWAVAVCLQGFTRCAQQRWLSCFRRCEICLLSAHAGMENAATCWPSCTACSA